MTPNFTPKAEELLPPTGIELGRQVRFTVADHLSNVPTPQSRPPGGERSSALDPAAPGSARDTSSDPRAARASPPPEWSGYPAPRSTGIPAFAVLLGVILGAGIGFVGATYLNNSHSANASTRFSIAFEVTGSNSTGSASTYSFLVTAVNGSGVTYADVEFLFTNQSGGPVSPTGDWSVRLTGTNVTGLLGTWAGGSQGFSGWGSERIESGQVWSLSVPAPPIGGGTLTIEGIGAYSGAYSVGLP